jgi:hypothetical protein
VTGADAAGILLSGAQDGRRNAHASNERMPRGEIRRDVVAEAEIPREHAAEKEEQR